MKTLHASGLSLFQRTADVARVSVAPSSPRSEPWWDPDYHFATLGSQVVEVREEEELTKETVEAVLLA
jgi:hypothetical protein